MDTNLIRPYKEKFRTFYGSIINFCDGNACAAGLMDIFDRFHSIKLQQQKSNRKHNDIAQQHGDSRSQDEYLYQSHTQEELVEYLMGMFSINTIRVGIKVLLDKKIITAHKNPNPKYQFDKTTHYLFHSGIFNEWIKKQDYIVPDSRNTNLQSRSHNFEESNLQNNNNRNHKFDDAIDNKDLNKENNLNLFHEENKTSDSEKNTTLGEVNFFEINKKNNNQQPKTSEPETENKLQSTTNPFANLGNIEANLTKQQQQVLKSRFKLLQEKSFGKISAPDELRREIEFCLLNKNVLSQCENNFYRKLCCIEDLIIKGKWRTPFKFNQKLEQFENHIDSDPQSSKRHKIDHHLFELHNAISSDEEFLNLLPDEDEHIVTKQMLKEKNQQRREKLNRLLAEKQELIGKNNQENSVSV